MSVIQLEELLTIDEAARLMKVSPHTIRSWFTRGPMLPRVKAQRRTLLRRSDLEKCLVVQDGGKSEGEAGT
jgi:excisionase family DNA binding protein